MKGVKQAFISVALGLLMALGVFSMPLRAAGAQSRLWFQTPTTTTVYGNLLVDVMVNTGSQSVNAVQANIQYDPNYLALTEVDTSNTAFTVDAQNEVDGTVLKLARGSFTSVSGSQKIARLHFIAKRQGATTVDFAAGSAVARSSDNQNDLNATDATSLIISAPVFTPHAAETATPTQANTPADTTQLTSEQLQTFVRRLYALFQAL